MGVFFLLVWGKPFISKENSLPVLALSNDRGNTAQLPVNTSNSSVSESLNLNSSKYTDGTYTGDTTDAFYGLLQVQVTINDGKIDNIIFLKYPDDNSTSLFVNEQAIPLLKSEAIAAQSADIDIVSGASESSTAFRQSLASALEQAK